MSKSSRRPATAGARAPEGLKGIVDRRKVTKIFFPPKRGTISPAAVRKAVKAVMAERAQAASEEA